MRTIPETIKQLLIINVLFFIGSQFLGDFSNDLLALHYFENDKFIVTQVFTHMFMHGNLYHIIFNMIGLWMFGSPLVQMWGKNKFLFFYFLAQTKSRFYPIQFLIHCAKQTNLNPQYVQ